MGKKLVLFPVLLAFGCLVAGGYGALHNQISYSVSPEYFHGFKFQQFEIPEAQRNRLGASIVGWLASWWMGLIIGVPVLAVGLVMPDWKTYLTRSMLAYLVVIATAMAFGLGALAWATRTLTSANLPEFAEFALYHPLISDQVAFARAGTMHNASYLGGFLGIFTASAYLLLARLRLSRRDPAHRISGKSVRAAVGLMLMTLAPFIVASVYLVAANSILVNRLIDMPIGPLRIILAFAACLCPGILGMYLLPFSRSQILCIALVYVPSTMFLLIFYSLCFVSFVFGGYL